MKILINKANPAIRVTAPEIELVHTEPIDYWRVREVGCYAANAWELKEEVKEEICPKCVYYKKDDGYCYNPNGGMKRRINENGVYECTAFWEREQEEPKRKQSPALKKIVDNLSKEKLAKTRAEMKAVEEEPEKVNCPFDKGDCRYCTVQFCGAREENQIETRSTAEPVDLEKTVEFECIGKKVKMTVQELIDYYIDSECVDVADECGF